MMKLVIKGNKEDIKAFKSMLINNVVICPFINNDNVQCKLDNCKDCVKKHIVFKEK